MYGDVYNTKITLNGDTIYSRSYRPGQCCCGTGFMNSCFGMGYNNALYFAGITLGVALAPALPSLFSGLAKGVVSVAPKIWNGICYAGKKVAQGAAWLGGKIVKGVSNLWNKIFHKKSKVKTEKAE